MDGITEEQARRYGMAVARSMREQIDAVFAQRNAVMREAYRQVMEERARRDFALLTEIG